MDGMCQVYDSCRIRGSVDFAVPYAKRLHAKAFLTKAVLKL